MQKDIKTKNQNYYCYRFLARYSKKKKALEAPDIFVRTKTYEMEGDKLSDFLLEDITLYYEESCNRSLLLTTLIKPKLYKKEGIFIIPLSVEDDNSIVRITHIISERPLYEKEC